MQATSVLTLLRDALTSCTRTLNTPFHFGTSGAASVPFEVSGTIESHYDLRVAKAAGFIVGAVDLNDMLIFSFLQGFLLERHVSQRKIGICISLLSFGMLFLTPCMPMIIRSLGGPSRTLGVGIVAFTVMRIVNAFLPYVADGLPLFIVTSIIFLFTGCAYAMTEVTALSACR